MENKEELEYLKKKLRMIDEKFDEIQDDIDSSKEDFDDEVPEENHEENFLKKLQSRFKEYVDLTPYLIKVAIVTILIFCASIFIWYSFMRPDPSKSVIKNIIEQFERKK